MTMLTSRKFPYEMTPAELGIEAAARRALGEAIAAWRAAALADGWTITPTYAGVSIERDFKMGAPNGFRAIGMLRMDELPAVSLHLYDGEHGVSLDDALAFPYDMATLVAGRRTCPQCGATDVETVKVAFANRACRACAPALRQQLETPGWCD